MLARLCFEVMRVTRSFPNVRVSPQSPAWRGDADAKAFLRARGANVYRPRVGVVLLQQEVHVRTGCFDPSFFLHFCLPHTMCGFDTLVQ